MKIVHIMGYFVPELGYQEYYLAKAHKKMGHDVYVVASDMIYPFSNIKKMFKDIGKNIKNRKRKPGFEVIDGLKVHWMPHIVEYTDFILCRNVGKVLEKIRPDIVFAHESRQGMTCQAAPYKEKLGFKLIVDQHDNYHEMPGKIKNFLRATDYFGFRKHLIDYNFRKSDRIVAVTKRTKEFLIKTHKISPKKIELIELGVDTDLYKYKRKEAIELRKKLGIKGNEIVLIFSGIIFSRKNIELLINAFYEIYNDYNLRLIIVGDGEKGYMQELKQLARDLKLGNKIIFSGFVKKEKLPVYYSAADIGVWPGNNSVSIIEAMACRLPIIMAHMQLPHLVSHNNGFKFLLNDKKNMKQCLIKLIKNKQLRDRMGNNSLKAVSKYYSYSIAGRKFLEAAK